MAETALALPYPVDADVPDGPTQIGNLAKKVDELLQAGGVAKHLFISGEITRTSTTAGSFGTPVKITLPKVAANQIIEVSFSAFVAPNTTEQAILGLSIDGSQLVGPGGSGISYIGPAGGPNVWRRVMTTEEYSLDPSSEAFSLEAVESYASALGSATIARALAPSGKAALGPRMMPFKAATADRTNVEVEILGRVSGGAGSIKMRGAFLAVRVSG